MHNKQNECCNLQVKPNVSQRAKQKLIKRLEPWKYRMQFDLTLLTTSFSLKKIFA